MKKSLHGMTSEQAREKKLVGHENEKKVALELNATIIHGNQKVDVINNSGKYSVKTGTKTQWALYSENRVLSGSFNQHQIMAFNNFFSFLPDSKEEYLNNRLKYKNNPFVNDIFNAFSSCPMDMVKFFCGYNEIDIFYLTDIRDGSSYEVNSNIFFEKIKNSIKSVYTTEGGKFVISGGDKNIILFELELRKGTNHKKILFHSHLARIIDIIKK